MTLDAWLSVVIASGTNANELCVIEKQYRFPSPLAIWTDRKRIAGFLGNASAIVSEFGMQPSTRIARGIPACKVIKNVATAIGTDAIVVGTQRRAGEDTGDYGSAIQALLGEISVPVIVIHESRQVKNSVLRLQYNTEGRYGPDGS